MTIKADRWITRMAREHGMIEPFEAQQVRDGVISYGLSSYGYDFRVADEFKVFAGAGTGAVTGHGEDVGAAAGGAALPTASSGSGLSVGVGATGAIIDPKRHDPQAFTDLKADVCIIPPHSFILARTVEYFRIPRDVLTICFGKSTYARCGVVINVTPFEPEWEGFATLAISNTAPVPAKIYANEGIAQLLFFQSDEPCEVSYGDKKGKYQAQRAITTARI